MEQQILVVDDERYIRLLIEQALEELVDCGVELLFAQNGEEALALVCAERPAIVLLDVMMPKLNGFEVCRMIKQELGLSQIYVVLLTAKGQEFDRQRGHAVGADLYVTKPFDPDLLLRITAEALQRRRLAPAVFVQSDVQSIPDPATERASSAETATRGCPNSIRNSQLATRNS